MDVLSDVITMMRTGRPVAALTGWRVPYAQEFAAVPGSAGFQVVREGPCWLLRAGADPVRLAVGDMVFRPHGGGHVLADDPATRPIAPACDPREPPSTGNAGTDTVVLCGAYEMGRNHPLLDGLPELVHLPAGEAPRPAVDLLAGELDAPGLGTDAMVPALLDTLLLLVLRTWLRRRPGNPGWTTALSDPPVLAALQAMHREPARPWTVAALGAEGGLSRAPFARRFTELVGQPPLAYLTWWRMSVAARLLHESDAPLSSIAGRVGYASEFSFAAAFKRQHGIAPGRYRRAG